MQNTPFHSYIAARRLSGLANSEALLPVFASSSIGIYPYQIAAARFTMRSHYIKGCILCDEGSLGKTYEALLIAAQRWYEGKTRILVVLPLNLVRQWIGKIENSFTLPCTLWNSENNNEGRIPDADGLIMTTYAFAVRNEEAIGSRAWDLVIFDAADALFKPENKTVIALKAATGAAFKLRGVTDTAPRHELDTHVPKEAILERYIRENGSAQVEEIERIKLRAMRKKMVLEHTLNDIRTQVKAIKNEQSAQAHDRMKALAIGKKLKELEKELRGKEQNLYFDQMRVAVAEEEEIVAISAMEKYDVRIRQHFVVRVEGENDD